jgi:hypothetical protein
MPSGDADDDNHHSDAAHDANNDNYDDTATYVDTSTHGGADAETQEDGR